MIGIGEHSMMTFDSRFDGEEVDGGGQVVWS